MGKKSVFKKGAILIVAFTSFVLATYAQQGNQKPALKPASVVQLSAMVDIAQTVDVKGSTLTYGSSAKEITGKTSTTTPVTQQSPKKQIPQQLPVIKAQ